MNDRNLALKISKHPLIRRLLETKMATSSIVARLIVEELMSESEEAEESGIGDQKALELKMSIDGANNLEQLESLLQKALETTGLSEKQKQDLQDAAAEKQKDFSDIQGEPFDAAEKETESAPEEFEVLMKSAIKLSQKDKIKGFNKLQMLVAATLKVFFAGELQENVTAGDIIQGLLQKITGNKQINSNSLAKYIDFLKYIGKSIPQLEEGTPYEVLQFLLEKPENQAALQKYVTGQEKDSTPKSTSKVSPVGLFVKMYKGEISQEEAENDYKRLKGEVVDELKGEESVTPEEIKARVQEKLPTKVSSEEKEQISDATTEDIIDEKELEVSEKEAGIDPEDKNQPPAGDLEQPDYFDLDTAQKQQFEAAATAFVNEFYEKDYLYEQGQLAKEILAVLLSIKNQEQSEKAAKRVKKESLREEEDNFEASKGRLRGVQIAFRTFLQDIKITKKALKDFQALADKGSIVASSRKEKFIKLLERQQEDIVSLFNSLVDIYQKAGRIDEAEASGGATELKWEKIEQNYDKAAEAIKSLLGLSDKPDAELRASINLIDDAVGALRELSKYFPNVNPFGRKDDDYDKFEGEYEEAVEEAKRVILQPILELTRAGSGSTNVIEKALKGLKDFSQQIYTTFGVKTKFKDRLKVLPDQDEAAAEPDEEKQKLGAEMSSKVRAGMSAFKFKYKATSLFGESVNPSDDEIKVLYKFYQFMRKKHGEMNENIQDKLTSVGYVAEDIQSFQKDLSDPEFDLWKSVLEKIIKSNKLDQLVELVFPVSRKTINQIITNVNKTDPSDEELDNEIKKVASEDFDIQIDDTLLNKVKDLLKRSKELLPPETTKKVKDKIYTLRLEVLKQLSPGKFGAALGLANYSKERLEEYRSVFLKFLLALKHFSKDNLEEAQAVTMVSQLRNDLGEFSREAVENSLNTLSVSERDVLKVIHEQKNIGDLYKAVKPLYNSEKFSSPIDTIKAITPEFFSKGYVRVKDPKGKVDFSSITDTLADKLEVESEEAEEITREIQKVTVDLGQQSQNLSQAELVDEITDEVMQSPKVKKIVKNGSQEKKIKDTLKAEIEATKSPAKKTDQEELEPEKKYYYHNPRGFKFDKDQPEKSFKTAEEIKELIGKDSNYEDHYILSSDYRKWIKLPSDEYPQFSISSEESSGAETETIAEPVSDEVGEISSDLNEISLEDLNKLPENLINQISEPFENSDNSLLQLNFVKMVVKLFREISDLGNVDFENQETQGAFLSLVEDPITPTLQDYSDTFDQIAKKQGQADGALKYLKQEVDKLDPDSDIEERLEKALADEIKTQNEIDRIRERAADLNKLLDAGDEQAASQLKQLDTLYQKQKKSQAELLELIPELQGTKESLQSYRKGLEDWQKKSQEAAKEYEELKGELDEEVKTTSLVKDFKTRAGIQEQIANKIKPLIREMLRRNK